MLYLKQSTASQNVLIGPFVDSTDGVTAETGLTIANTDIRLSKNGANIAAKNSGGGTHDENGWYQITLDATDTNTVGRLQLHCVMSGALPVWHEYWVLEEDIYEALFASGAAAFNSSDQVAVGSIAANAITATAIASNAITAAKIATDAITAAKIAADAIGASELAADAATEIATSVWGAATRVLTANTNLNDPTAAAIADAVWDEDATGHQTGGTFGQAIGDPGANTETMYDAVVTDAAGTNVAADIIALDAVADDILLDTAEIGTAGAGLTAVPWNSSWDAEVQSEVQDAIEANHLDHLVARTGTVPTGGATSTQVYLDAGASASDDFYNGTYISIISGTGAGQSRFIRDYTGSSNLAFVAPGWSTWPSTDSVFVIWALPGFADVQAWAGFGAATDSLDYPGVGIISISGDETAANNLEAAFDGTGYDLGGIDVSELNTAVDAIGTPSDFGSGTSTLAANLQDIADNGTATYDRSTDSLQAIRDRGDSAWTGGGGSSLELASGTIGATGNDTTHLHLTGLTYADDALNDCLIVVYDDSASLYYSTWITDWVAATDLATVDTLPFTPEDSTDTYVVLGIRQDVTGGSGLDAAGVRAAVGLASANLDTQLSTIDGNVDDIEAAIGTPSDLGSGATVAANLSDIEAQTDDIGAAGAGLTAVPWNASWDAEVQSEVTDALNAYDPPTRAELTSDINSLNDPTAAAIADAVLDEALSGHTTAGTLGKAVADIETDATAILADTNELQTDDIPGTLSSMDSKLDTIDNFLDTEIAAILEDTGTTIPALIAALNNLSSSDIATALATYDAPTKAELDAGLAALNDLSAAEVNAQVLDVLNTDTFAEPTGVPAATVTLATKIGFLYMALRNQVTITATKKTFYDDAGNAEWEKDLSDDGTTYTETEGNSV